MRPLSMLPLENRIYARWLDLGTHLGLVVLVSCFFAYTLALLEPFVPLRTLASLWGLPVDRYIAATGAPTGWGWVRALDKGDYLNMVGVVILAAITMVCYARMVPVLIRNGERLQAALAIAQVAVLVAAASGVFAGVR